MQSIVDQNRPELARLCERHRVKQLGLIGSALRTDFDAVSSDLDFVVEFDHLTTVDAADRYFGLLADLEDLFQRRIDLVSYTAIRNPFFRQVVDRTRVTLYAA